MCLTHYSIGVRKSPVVILDIATGSSVASHECAYGTHVRASGFMSLHGYLCTRRIFIKTALYIFCSRTCTVLFHHTSGTRPYRLHCSFAVPICHRLSACSSVLGQRNTKGAVLPKTRLVLLLLLHPTVPKKLNSPYSPYSPQEVKQ